MDIVNSGIYIEDEKLGTYALSAAKLLPVEGECSLKGCTNRLRRAYNGIRRCHDTIKQRYGDLPSPPAACEWLMDNWYMVQREYRFVLSELEKQKKLRSSGGTPILSELCRSLVSAGGGAVTPERCRLYLEGFQQQSPLQRRELMLFPAMLRHSIIESIASVCRGMQYAAETTAHAKALSNLFSSLRLLSVIDMEKLIQSVDLSDSILARDPSGHYLKMDNPTRQAYLRRLEKLSRAEGISEQDYARRLLKQARRENIHIGKLLFPPKKRGAGLYIAVNVLSTLFISLLLALSFSSPAAAFLLLVPVSQMVKSLIDYILLHIVPPTRLPRMDTQKGIPEEGRCICVISALLTGTESIEHYSRSLEELYMACRSEGGNMYFALLADLPASDSEFTEADGELLRAGRIAINSLNRKYGGRFYLFTRGRSFDGEKYTGFERKRGALLELAKLLCDMESSLQVYGERDSLSTVRYILTLDSDTRIYPGTAGELVGAMLHPLNTPHIDPEHHIVTGGHGIIHPRMATDLASANATDFSIIFAGAGGSDPYASLCGELYMDAFGSGGFAGKGIIDARALVECTAKRFPRGRILSHDALEGAYLRGAYMGDAEFSDAFPANALSYYKRQHRWIRGDWQNLPWLFKRGRELRDIDRWRLFDSLRRSLISPLTLAAILAGFFLPGDGIAVAAWAALLSLLSSLFLSLAQSSTARSEKVRLRHYTRLLTGVGGSIVQTFIRLWLLPFEAWVCISAISTALWRMFVSHRRLLQWQTAEQAGMGGSGLKSHVRSMWFAMLLGLALLVFPPQIAAKSAGLMWLLSPFMAAALALPSHKESSLSPGEKNYLIYSAAELWSYLDKFSTAEDNFLPPDNFQEQPPVGIAHRTSPTNMGLAMTAAVAAMDMGIIPASRAIEYITDMLSTMERMPKCKGHFYNWYDTRTLLPLAPAYVSTVDSGNLCAGLIAVRQAMLELNESSLACHISAILEAMDFSPLYDSERNLFFICYDAAAERSAGGWYDLLASEAMLTSYIAVAKGDVPKKHWRRLSRAQLQKDGYRGLASWTGTMFEYLMPELFLPLYRGSLLYESSRFCVYAQRRRVFAGKPWGISESAFFSLDSALNYRYKAHGCAALALKRGQEKDMVISPYSSFLALAVEPKAALRNLQRLEALGAVGRFGFIEALDFTPGRCRSDSGEQVRCYMAHHVSMSIIAAANAVCGGSIEKRFMAEPAMAAHSLLLQEKLPENGIVIRRDMTDVPEKPERRPQEGWHMRGDREEAGHYCVLSNGSYSLLVSGRGGSCANLGGLCVYRWGGPALRVRREDISVLLPGDEEYIWELAEEEARFSGSSSGIDYSISVSAAAGDCGELRHVELMSEKSCKVELSMAFEPILRSLADFTSHPAYGRLGMQAEFAPGHMLLHKLRRGDEADMWLCLACDNNAEFNSDIKGALEHISAPLAAAKLSLRLEPGVKSAVRFALCVSDSARSALEAAQRVLKSESGQRGNMVGAASALLGMSASETGAAMDMLSAILNPGLYNAAPRRDLWAYGISGDLPIICCDGRATESEKLLRRFCLLKSCGVETDLVYFTDEQGEYQRPTIQRLSQLLSNFGLEALIDVAGGVHFVPESGAELIRSRAAYAVGSKRKQLKKLRIYDGSKKRRRANLPAFLSDEAFRFEAGGSLPPRIWQLPITNGRLGCIAADFGPACMWYENAREMQITAPPDNIRATSASEGLSLSFQGDRYSAFAANDGCPCTVSFSPGICVWEKQIGKRLIKSSLFVPPGIDARVIIVEGAKGMEFNWAMQPLLGARDAGSLLCRAEGRLFIAENPESYLENISFRAAVSMPSGIKCSFAPAAMEISGILDSVSVFVCGCCSGDELLSLCEAESAFSALEASKQRWESILSGFHIHSGNGAFDRYMNRWAMYQTIACRLEGRCSLYQSGGAFGFRDQLQDAVNLLLVDKSYAAQRILDCCRHQYVEGDVMHWWHRHPDGDRGVRSRCSDDMLWLCWALCEYVEATGDTELCSIELNYISSPLLTAAERDRYETPEISSARASVLDHAKAALECCISRGLGQNSLPLFLSGDWNDAFDRTGGESVWLAWFFSHCAERFARLLKRLGKNDFRRYEGFAASMAESANAAWAGQHFIRGYDAKGAPLGGTDRIDSVAQSWAAFFPGADPIKTKAAVLSAYRRLFDRRNSLVKLFDPPYSHREDYIGYVSGYGEGFRENGGQYTHGAIWLALACLRQGYAAEGWELMQALLPENRELKAYEAEPFVLAADVYSADGHKGEAGWSWYTGSAGWYFRAAAEFLGLRLRDGKLYVEPCCPELLPEYSVDWRDEAGQLHHITVKGGEVSVDGKKYTGGPI